MGSDFDILTVCFDMGGVPDLGSNDALCPTLQLDDDFFRSSLHLSHPPLQIGLNATCIRIPLIKLGYLLDRLLHRLPRDGLSVNRQLLGTGSPLA